MRSDRTWCRQALVPIAALLAGAGPAAAAPPTLGDDARCLLLSTGYARAAKDDATRRTAIVTGAFFLGRLSGRAGDAALTTAFRAQGTQLSGKEAEPLMRTCAARAAAADQAIAAMIRTAQSTR